MVEDKTHSDTESFDIGWKLQKEKVISHDQLEIAKKEKERLKNTLYICVCTRVSNY